MFNIKELLFNKLLLGLVPAVILGLLILVIIFLVKQPITSIIPSVKSPPNNQLTSFGKAKFKILPLLKSQSTTTVSAQPKIYQLKEATLTYLPLSNTFIGSVDEAKTETQYSLAKKNLVEDLKTKGIDVCSLKIYWERPTTLSLDQMKPGDFSTDGCK